MGTKAPYQTKQMKQILAYLQTIEGTHVTAADVCSYFKEQGINVGTTTVYRNLEKMVEQGLVAKYNVDGTSSACFEYLGEPGSEKAHHILHTTYVKRTVN